MSLKDNADLPLDLRIRIAANHVELAQMGIQRAALSTATAIRESAALDLEAAQWRLRRLQDQKMHNEDMTAQLARGVQYIKANYGNGGAMDVNYGAMRPQSWPKVERNENGSLTVDGSIWLAEESDAEGHRSDAQDHLAIADFLEREEKRRDV